MAFSKINAEALSGNVFERIGKQWMLISAQADGRANAMTASWGGLGVLWHKNVATCYIRPQRFTLQLVDKADRFALTFLPETCREALRYLGTVSGYQEDKQTGCGLTPMMLDGVPSYEEAELVLICRKIYTDTIKPENFLDETIAQNYPNKDYHRVFIGQIEAVYEKTC
ncbi:MAG: flavin reductase [Clostridia bacterium]|nr:flavin reductase [Clostridia bacterium]